jgi:hypothetical protein
LLAGVYLAPMNPPLPQFTQDALRLLRDPTQFKWYAIAFLGLVIYIYAVEIEKRNWNTVFAALAFWSVDWINEVINALVFHFSGKAAIWTTTGSTSFQILIGLNLEIATLFAVAGIVFAKQFPPDPKLKILGIPNRWALVLGFSIFSVFVELLLHQTGTFHWYYPWWNERQPWLIVFFGYGTFYAAAAWVHDLPTLAKKIRFTGALAGTAAGGLVVFGPILGWI